MTTPVLVLAFVVLLFLAASFSALETALFALRERHAVTADPHRDRMSPKATALLRNPLSRLHEVLLVGAVCNVLLAALGLFFVMGPLAGKGWNVWLSGLAIFGLVLVVVEIIPKALALHASERTMLLTLPLLTSLHWIFAPTATALVRASESVVRRITPKRIKPAGPLVAEEIETLIEMREEQGVITPEGSAVLQEIVKLDTLTVKDCMTPRVDLPLMPHDATEEEAARMLESGTGRFVLVFDEKADLITSIVDTEAWRLAQRPAWERIGQAPVLVPETMSVLDALSLHLTGPSAAVAIVDEYGGFEGLLTHANMVERLIGKAAPAPSTQRAIQMTGEGRYLVNGSTRIEEVNNELEIDLEAEGVDTIGGLVFNHFGYLPKPGERTSFNGVKVKVKRIGRNRITQLELRLEPNPEAGMNP
jgi:CBS domain containing-hemolysin-like protein